MARRHEYKSQIPSWVLENRKQNSKRNETTGVLVAWHPPPTRSLGIRGHMNLWVSGPVCLLPTHRMILVFRDMYFFLTGWLCFWTSTAEMTLSSNNVRMPTAWHLLGCPFPVRSLSKGFPRVIITQGTFPFTDRMEHLQLLPEAAPAVLTTDVYEDHVRSGMQGTGLSTCHVEMLPDPRWPYSWDSPLPGIALIQS